MGRTRYSSEPDDPVRYTREMDRLYTTWVGLYDRAVRRLPIWKTWLGRALPHLQGPRVLEVSFGTGYLLTRYAARYETYGVDPNRAMIATARANLRRMGVSAELSRGRVEALPYRDGAFDTVLLTMAFSGYPEADPAMAELVRVLAPAGRLVLVDVAHPADGNRLGTAWVAFAKRAGDLVRDMSALFDKHGMVFSDEEIGGWGSVHLYVATRNEPA